MLLKTNDNYAMNTVIFQTKHRDDLIPNPCLELEALSQFVSRPTTIIVRYHNITIFMHS